MKQENCTVKGCRNEGRYCRLHQSFTVKELKPIAKQSESLKEANKEYAKKCAAFKKKHPQCQAKIKDVCTGKTQHIHHMKGRIGDNLTNEKFFLAVCGKCHAVIEQNPAFARQEGLSISRHNKDAA